MGSAMSMRCCVAPIYGITAPMDGPAFADGSVWFGWACWAGSAVAATRSGASEAQLKCVRDIIVCFGRGDAHMARRCVIVLIAKMVGSHVGLNPP